MFFKKSYIMYLIKRILKNSYETLSKFFSFYVLTFTLSSHFLYMCTFFHSSGLTEYAKNKILTN